MAKAPPQPPPGWYQDPDDPTRQRWWDGGKWAEPPPDAAAQAAPIIVQTPSVNGLAVGSFVLSLLWLFGVGSVLAVIFGHVALRQIKRSQGRQSGRGLAVAGLIIGYVGFLPPILFYVFEYIIPKFLPSSF
jgi:hypothetical protein